MSQHADVHSDMEPVETHLAEVLAAIQPLAPVLLSLADAEGAVLAEDVTAGTPLPSFDNSAMDGYAVQARDLEGASDQAPVTLPVTAEIAAVRAAIGPDLVLKVILETAALSMDEKIAGCVLAKAAGAAYVKTSTGFGAGGATVEDISLMRRIVGAGMGVKASGGIRTAEDAAKMFAAGADRVGASASVAIVTGQKAVEGKY